jgi:shikimate kinase/3-dehydroquinate synthase
VRKLTAPATLGYNCPVLLKRPIFLNGMMGTGKSAVGRAAADRAGVAFVDLDLELERQAGMSVRQIFEKLGEPSFRSLEREAVCRELEDRTPRVIALGGGALLGRRERLLALERATLLTLTAPPTELLLRMRGDRTRPMLGDVPALPKLAEILESRASAYAEAHAVLDTMGATIESLAANVLEISQREPIAVPLGERSYTVDVVPGGGQAALSRALAELAPSRIVVVTDDVVEPLVLPRLKDVLLEHGESIQVVLPTGERHKTLASVEKILRAAVEGPVDRNAVVVGIGGGVVTDIAGLAAALALRGLRWVAVPTTVLSMVDASVGGKTAVDLGNAKNAVGAFHQPSRVVVDPIFSQTETPRAFRSGLAEVLKTALIGDPQLYRELGTPGGAERLAIDRDPDAVTRAVRSSVTVKAAVVGRDEREKGERAHLNLGHTIGHALEAEGGFQRLTHGEAVSLGLCAALRVGVALGVTSRELASQIEHVLARLLLPVDLDREPLTEALRWVGYDKKRNAGALQFVLVRAPGSLEIARISAADLPSLLRPI